MTLRLVVYQMRLRTLKTNAPCMSTRERWRARRRLWYARKRIAELKARNGSP